MKSYIIETEIGTFTCHGEAIRIDNNLWLRVVRNASEDPRAEETIAQFNNWKCWYIKEEEKIDKFNNWKC